MSEFRRQFIKGAALGAALYLYRVWRAHHPPIDAPADAQFWHRVMVASRAVARVSGRLAIRAELRYHERIS